MKKDLQGVGKSQAQTLGEWAFTKFAVASGPMARRFAVWVVASLGTVVAFAACTKRPSEALAQSSATSTARAASPEVVAPKPSKEPAYRLAVVGDFGSTDDHEAAVAKLVKSWNPSAILTTGDNIYPDGGGSYDEAVGAYYADFIGSYHGTHGSGSPHNRFWPAPGNHDWAGNENLANFRAFFTLPAGPGAGRYYDTPLDDEGLAHLYVVDSDAHEPDGIGVDSKQAKWLQDSLRANATKACFHLVAFHHPPYTTITGHGPAMALRWPFKAWGADLVLNGHNHHYERLVIDGFPYVVSGNAGAHLYEHRAGVAEGSVFFDDTHYGALRLGVARGELYGESFVAQGGSSATPVDTFLLKKTCSK